MALVKPSVRFLLLLFVAVSVILAATASSATYLDIPEPILRHSRSPASSPLQLGERVEATFEYINPINEAPETCAILLAQAAAAAPIQIAAATLERFKTIVLENVEDFIAREVNVQDFTLRVGNLALDVIRRDDICWNVLQGFLEEMRRMTQNEGPMAGYEGHIVNVATQY
ncbi:MAG: hypothetical protein Q9222_003429 [Ikaeria aurantiellina]